MSFALLAVLLIVVTVLYWHAQRRMTERLYRRQVVMDKQMKVLRRDVERARRLAVESIDKSKHLREDALLTYQRVDQALAETKTRRQRSG